MSCYKDSGQQKRTRLSCLIKVEPYFKLNGSIWNRCKLSDSGYTRGWKISFFYIFWGLKDLCHRQKKNWPIIYHISPRTSATTVYIFLLSYTTTRYATIFMLCSSNGSGMQASDHSAAFANPATSAPFFSCLSIFFLEIRYRIFLHLSTYLYIWKCAYLYYILWSLGDVQKGSFLKGFTWEGKEKIPKWQNFSSFWALHEFSK